VGRKGRPEEEDGPDRWAPPVSRRKREKAGRWWSGGFNWAGGLLRMRAEKKRRRRVERGWAAGEREGREGLIFFSFSFSNPF
jgi:hypothetical protein